jgi:peptide/nickel transport system substrate-binding protein
MLAEPIIAGHGSGMKLLVSALLVVAVAAIPTACREQPQGALKAVVIGDQPKIRDPALGPLPSGDAVLLENVAQGLVSFDANGNIVGGLAERWNVSDDGLSYIFRLAPANWPDGKKITAQQVAKLLKRQLAERSQNPIKDSLGAVDDIVAMTDRVIEIRLLAPRPNLLSLLAQPELAILRGNAGTGPFQLAASPGAAGELRLTREITDNDEEESRKEEVLLAGENVQNAIGEFDLGKSDLVLGGTFVDLPFAQHAKLPGGALRFDPASGLFGLVPAHGGAPFDDPNVRQLLSQALDRTNFVNALAVPGLAARATVLEPGLDGIAPPVQPAWFAAPISDRLAALRAQSDKLFGKNKPVIHVALPVGPGADMLLQELVRDWGAIGLTVQRAQPGTPADFTLIDEIAPSTSSSWFLRQFRCGAAAICDDQADALMEAARQTPVPQQRYALLAQAAARIEDAQLFIPIAAPVRWSLVSGRVQGFAGNRYARHTLTGLEQQPGTGD